eukprot:6202461-Pleurochrysis_carterae.AAC.1
MARRIKLCPRRRKDEATNIKRRCLKVNADEPKRARDLPRRLLRDEATASPGERGRVGRKAEQE